MSAVVTCASFSTLKIRYFPVALQSDTQYIHAVCLCITSYHQNILISLNSSPKQIILPTFLIYRVVYTRRYTLTSMSWGYRFRYVARSGVYTCLSAGLGYCSVSWETINGVWTRDRNTFAPFKFTFPYIRCVFTRVCRVGAARYIAHIIIQPAAMSMYSLNRRALS